MTITPSTEFTIDANGAEPIAIARINATQSIVAFRDSAATTLEVRVVGSDESIGAAEQITSNPSTASASVALCVLSSAQAIVFWDDASGGASIAVIAISGTTLTFNAGSLVNPSNSGSSSYALVTLSANSFASVHGSNATYWTISGTTITEESFATYDNALNASLAGLTTTKLIVAYSDSLDSDILKMCVLTITGSTISAGTPVNIEASDVGSGGENGDTALAAISSSLALLAYANHTDEILKAVVISISGSTPSANTPVSVDTWTSAGGEAIRALALVDFSTTQMGLSYNYQIAGTSRIAELTISGTNVTDAGSVSLTSDSTVGSRAIMFSSTLGIIAYSGSAKGVIVTASPSTLSELDIAPMRKPASIDADGTYVYIGALNSSGNPVLIKILGDLSTDGEIVFDPGSGDDIGVEAGNFNEDVVWIAGLFGGTNVVEKTEDAGVSFTIKDDGTFDPVTSFIVGPDNDERVLIFTNAASTSIHETDDDGDNWEEKNSALSLISRAVARLDVNVQEIISGNEAATVNNIDYSPNSGENLEDYSTGFPEVDVSGVAIG